MSTIESPHFFAKNELRESIHNPHPNKMITDIFSNVASFMDFADDLVYAIPDAYRLSFAQLQNMDVMTMKMLYTSPQVAKTCLHPEVIAEAILLKQIPSNDKVIRNLAQNVNLVCKKDDACVAIRFVAYMIYHDEYSEEWEDDEMMKRLCKYDAVLHNYSLTGEEELGTLDEYAHGRSSFEMFLLLHHESGSVYDIACMCTDIEAFLEEVHSQGYYEHLENIIDAANISSEDRQRLRDKYYILSW